MKPCGPLVTVNVGQPGLVSVKRHQRKVGSSGRLYKPHAPSPAQAGVDTPVPREPESFAEAMGLKEEVDESPFSGQFNGIIANIREQRPTDGAVVGGTTLENSTFLQHEPTMGEVVSDRHEFEQSRDESARIPFGGYGPFDERSDVRTNDTVQSLGEFAVEEAKALPGQASEAYGKLVEAEKGFAGKVAEFVKGARTETPTTPELQKARAEREQARRDAQAAEDRLKAAIQKRKEQGESVAEAPGTKVEQAKASIFTKLAESIGGKD